MELYKAHRQWAERPADERFWTVDEMLSACKGYAESAEEKSIDFAAAKIVADAKTDNIAIQDGKQLIRLTNWSFSQLARIAEAPAAYLSTLPSQIAVPALTYGVDKFFKDRTKKTRQALVHSNGTNVARSITSDVYTRFWNYEVLERFAALQGEGWTTPPARPAHDDPRARPATKDDVAKCATNVQVGVLIGPAGLYASDHDMFAFLVRPDVRIDDGSDGGLSRGVWIENSEVGAGALKVTSFLYRYTCGNHIVWDASNVVEVSIKHVGDVQGKFAVESLKLDDFINASAKKDEAIIRKAKKLILGSSREEVLEAVYKAIAGNRRTGIPSGLNIKTLGAAYDAVLPDVDGNPASAWGYVQGMTRLSQATPYADKRSFLDKTASQVLMTVTA